MVRNETAAPHIVDVTMFISPTSGGVRRYLEEKHAWLQRQGSWRHTVVAPVDAAPGDSVVVPGVPLPFSHGYRIVLDRTKAARTIEALRPDLIEAGDPYRLAWSVLDAGQRLNVPTVAFCHSNLERLAEQTFGKMAGRAVRTYIHRLYSQFDLILAPSRWMCEQLRDNGLHQVEWQPLGVDTQTFHPQRRDPAWKMRLGLPESARVLLYIGRFAAEKHLDTLAAAVAALGPPYVLVAIGAGPHPPVGEQVRVLCFENDLPELARAVASADAFVHAGDQETFGLAALEALACGVPLIARPVAGLAELIDDSVGVPVADASPGAFADAIEELFADDPQRFAIAARRRAERHDWQAVMPRLLARYARLILGRRGQRLGAA